jgi:hypothetical protein
VAFTLIESKSALTKVSTGADLPDLGRIILEGPYEIMDIVFKPITLQA